MVQVVNTDSERLAIRIPADEKRLITTAARIENKSLTDFIRDYVVPEAQRVVNTDSVVTTEDIAVILNLLENPPAGTPALQDAISQFKENTRAHMA